MRVYRHLYMSVEGREEDILGTSRGVSTMYIFAAALGSTEKYYYGRRGYPVDPQQDLYWYSSKIVKQAMRCFGVACFTKKILTVYAAETAAHRKCTPAFV